MPQYDCKGREIQAGDLLRVPHFRERRHRKQIYMHKLVCRGDRKLNISKHGEYLYAVDVVGIFAKGSLHLAEKCPLSVLTECEIIDGGTVEKDDFFWERKRHVQTEVT